MLDLSQTSGRKVIEIVAKKLNKYSPFNEYGTYTLIHYIKIGDINSVRNIVVKNKIVIYEVNEINQSPLHIAVKYNQLKITEYLLK